MALAFGQFRCNSVALSSAKPSTSRPFSGRGTAVKAPFQPKSRAAIKRTKQIIRAAASLADAREVVLPADEVLQTLKITQRSDGMFIIEDVVEGSTAAGVVEKGSVLSGVSDPAAPESLWQLEARSSLRHVLDQMRMQQSTKVKLAILPPSAAEAEATGRLGLNRDGPVMNEKTAKRRQQQFEEFNNKERANAPTNWLLLAVGVVLVPAAAILALAISTGFLDEMNAGWRAGL